MRSSLLLLPLLLIACVIQGNQPAHDAPGEARSATGMVSAATPEATEAGLRVLRNGGNAVDAAVAVGFALAVTYPQAGNLGGGGFMVIRMSDGRTTTIDFRERAPAAATRDMFLDSSGNFLPERAQLGALAAGVPGSPAGLLLALERYGSKPLPEVLQPAIALADSGFTIHPRLHDDLAEKRDPFLQFPSTRAIFLPGDSTLAAGLTFRQPELAATLRRIADLGKQGFYGGQTARLIVEQMQRSGGIITAADLADYSATERTPLRATYRGYEIITMPPPSSGGVLLVQMLKMMEPQDFRQLPFHSAPHAHFLAEVMRRAYADRAEFLGDPDFVEIPVAGLTSQEYAAARAANITPRATPSSAVGHGDPKAFQRESQQTTHYSVVDRHGNCVSVTTTLNSAFGSKLVVGGAGFFLNNEMDDFSARPNTPNQFGLIGRSANAIQPGKRMLSSMTPTIVLRDGKPWMVVGTPGGSTIITTVLQMIHSQIDYGMDLAAAGNAPRIHHQWLPDTLFHERGAFTAGAADSLRAMGHRLVERPTVSGRVDAVRIETDSLAKPLFIGWSDTRGYGLAKGPD
ncbi:MAG: gamma-glutamyltransferase [Chlorobi bacterium]|nr:gamma-glutamyltransferase [Chlorobiota bacterium]MBX7215440.1 gamma-glutamyltransferase [Candidatus Kapabacteria bacterium]